MTSAQLTSMRICITFTSFTFVCSSSVYNSAFCVHCSTFCVGPTCSYSMQATNFYLEVGSKFTMKLKRVSCVFICNLPPARWSRVRYFITEPPSVDHRHWIIIKILFTVCGLTSVHLHIMLYTATDAMFLVICPLDKLCSHCLPVRSLSPNSKHWLTTSFLRRKVPESDARSVACLMTVLYSTLPKTTLCCRRKKRCFATDARADKSVAAQRVW